MPPCDTDPAGRADPGAVPPARPARSAGGPPATLAFEMPAELAAPWLTRSRVRAWLDELSWPDEPADDITYALSEAVSNVAEHAYSPGAQRGTVDVHAAVEILHGGTRRLRMRITDTGRWRPEGSGLPHRGRGIAMMNALMAEVMVHRGEGAGAGGTEVVLISPPVPPGRSGG
jgi:anti-sigma regulatory factor (Ser/Thr protein kinase)